MRVTSILMAATALGMLTAGCGPTMRWDKPGANAEAITGDQLECRRAAADEAFRSFAFSSGFGLMGAGYWGFRHQPEYFLWRQRIEADRSFYESRLANFCMRNKGYAQVPVNEQVPPAAVPAAPK